MIEYDPNGPDGDEHDLTPPADLPEHHLDDRFAEPHTPPLDDLGPDSATPPDALHFPGDDMTVDDAAPDTAPDADPTAPYPDDTGFSEWLSGSELPGPDDDPAATPICATSSSRHPRIRAICRRPIRSSTGRCAGWVASELSRVRRRSARSCVSVLTLRELQR